MSWRPRVLRGGRDETSPAEGPSDAELARLTLEGRGLPGDGPRPLPGRDAFSLLVERHQDRVYRLVLGVLGHPEDARDVTQEAFVRAYRSLKSYRPDLSFLNWLLKIAVNAARDERARRQRRPRSGLEGLEEIPEARPAGAAADRAVLLGQVRAALAELSDREREVFVLRELEGLEVETVARLLELAPPTVRRHLARARLRLRELLGTARTESE